MYLNRLTPGIVASNALSDLGCIKALPPLLDHPRFHSSRRTVSRESNMQYVISLWRFCELAGSGSAAWTDHEASLIPCPLCSQVLPSYSLCRSAPKVKL